MKLILLLSLLGASAISHAAEPCDGYWSVLLAPYDHPETATSTEWQQSRNVAHRLMTNCPLGPNEATAREAFFDFASRQFELDYDHLSQVWEEQGEPLSDGAIESIWYFETELRRYLTQIADPARDSKHAETLLKHAHGEAIARFGATVADAVRKLASSKTVREGYPEHRVIVHDHDSRVEAIRAIGLWLDPSTAEFSPRQRKDFAQLLIDLLPEPDFIPRSDDRRSTEAIIWALGHSSDPEVAAGLVDWLNAYLRNTGRTKLDSIAQAAFSAANAIMSNSRNP